MQETALVDGVSAEEAVIVTLRFLDARGVVRYLVHRGYRSTQLAEHALVGWECGWAYAISLCIFQIGRLAVIGAFDIWTIVAFAIVAAILFGLFRPMPRGQMEAVPEETAVEA